VRSATFLTALLSACWIGAAYGQSAAPAPAENPSLAEAPTLEVFPVHPHRDLVIRACAPCHVPELVVAKRHTEEEWDKIILTMIDRGAIATEDEQLQILEYLLHFFGPAASAPE
jgi:hypothetical protein